MPIPANAYLDANSISMVLQVIVGGIVGFLVLIKFHWQRVKNFLFRSEKTQIQKNEESAP